MTEESTTETDVLTGTDGDGTADPGTDGAADSGTDPTDDGSTNVPVPGDRDATTYLAWAVVAALGLLGLLAMFRFYNSASRAIAIWVAPQFEPLLQAAFNLLVLLVVAVAISLVVRETGE